MTDNASIQEPRARARQSEQTMNEYPELRLAGVILNLEICQSQGMVGLDKPLRELIAVYNDLFEGE